MEYEKLLYVGIAVVALVIVFNFISSMELSGMVEKKIEEAKEASVLPSVKLISIGVDCAECLDLSQLENALLTSLNANFTSVSLEYGTPEASRYISKYGIERLPALIVEGNTSVVANSQLGQVFEQRSGALVFEGLPPYVAASTGEKKGVVSALIVEPCEDCYDFTTLLRGLASNGVFLGSVDNVSLEESPVNVALAPSLLLSKDIEEYPQILSALQQLNVSEENGYYMLEPLAPYINLSSGEFRGNVSVYYIEKEGCDSCLSVSRLKDLVDRLGLYVDSEVYLNETSGKDLIEKYGIGVLPTVAIVGDVSAYSRLAESWKAVGSVFEDALVLRNLSLFGEDVQFYDLKEGKEVVPEFREIRVEGSEFSFSPSSITVKAGEKVRITFVNVGQAPHDFTIDELGIKTSVLAPGQSETLTFTAPSTGTFSFYCSVAGHRQAGMEGDLEVV